MRFLPRVLLLVAALPALARCNRDECRLSDLSCEGNVLVTCDAAWSDSDAPLVIRRRTCDPGSYCVVDRSGRASTAAFCAIDPKPDPQCLTGRGVFCDAYNEVVTCDGSYRVQLATCDESTTCTVDATSKGCVPKPPPGSVQCGPDQCLEVDTVPGRLTACCPDEGGCGLDVSALGLPPQPCLPKHQPGALDATCPTSVFKGMVNFPGCCRPNGACGAFADQAAIYQLDLGCIDPAELGLTSTAQACSPVN
jgi:hypothetical protein